MKEQDSMVQGVEGSRVKNLNMSNTAKVVDCNGIPVRIGTKVKIVRLLKRLLASLPNEEFEEVSQMIGKNSRG